jgi:hypothetical protein
MRRKFAIRHRRGSSHPERLTCEATLTKKSLSPKMPIVASLHLWASRVLLDQLYSVNDVKTESNCRDFLVPGSSAASFAFRTILARLTPGFRCYAGTVGFPLCRHLDVPYLFPKSVQL